MYSVVLMAALSSAPAEQPACCWWGCGPCYGGYYGYAWGPACYGPGCWWPSYWAYPAYWYYPGYYYYGWYGYPGVVIADAGKETTPKKPSTATARVVLQLPENAKLSLEGQEIQGSGTLRKFSTPPLEKGKAFSYTFQVEYLKNGQLTRETKKVIVRAGETAQASIGTVGNASLSGVASSK